MSLLYFNEDPFLKYRPFPASPKNYFEAHWHEIVGAFLFYVGIQYLLSVLLKRYVGKTYTDLNLKTRVNFDIHVTSMVQCVFSVLACVPMFNHPIWKNRLADPHLAVLGYYPFGGFISAISIGYFVWDLYVCLRYFKLFGPGFLFHAVAALYVFSACLYPFCLPWIPAFLLFEASTPFVNMNWFASRLPAGTFSDKFVMINGLLLMITFFVVRLVWGIYAVVVVAGDMWQVRQYIAWFLPVSILSLNAILDGLNAFWFYKMVAIAKRKFKGKAVKKE